MSRRSAYLALTDYKTAMPFTPLTSSSPITPEPRRDGPCLLSIPPEERHYPGDDLTPTQRLALLGMHSTLARGVAKRLAANEGVQTRPSLADYCELGRRFLCERLPGEQYHELTFEGSKLAKAVLQKACADLDVHILQVDRVTGEGRDVRTVYCCSCGQWSRSLQGNGQFAWRRAVNQFHEHWNPTARGVDE